MIISASRRCDIPAFFPEWLSRRLDEGYVVVRNPMFPEKLSKLSLSPSVVDAMVFWTKNPRPMMRYLDAIDSHNIPYCFHFTLTPYGCDIEPNLPEKSSLIETFRSLSDRIGSERMIWRYDPILISDAYNVAFHAEAFERMAYALEGYTARCVISFLDEDYKRVRKGNSATPFRAPTEDEMRHLAQAISASAASCGMTVESCAEEIDLTSFGIKHAHCIDSALIEKMCGYELKTYAKDPSQRKLCGCIASSDIGEYNACAHGCAYCYANYDEPQIRLRMKEHRSDSSVLIGELDVDADKLPFSRNQKSILNKKPWHIGEGLFD